MNACNTFPIYSENFWQMILHVRAIPTPTLSAMQSMKLRLDGGKRDV